MISRTNRYVVDILEQPACLRALLATRPEDRVAAIAAAIDRHDRIVLTGMGASLAAVGPLWLTLVAAGHAAWRVETARLVQDAPRLLTPRTLVIAASQSGRSAEIVALVDLLPQTGATLMALTNDGDSPLARAADVMMDVAAGDEHAVSTRSYTNTVAAGALVADAIAGRRSAASELGDAADGIEVYLGGWSDHVDAMAALIGLPPRLYLLARGASLAAAECGALILKEAAKWPVEALSAGQFRHGPLELADERLTAVVLAGEDPDERDRNARLLADLRRFGAGAVWADHRPPDDGAGWLDIPRAKGAGLAVAQIVPLQLLSVAIAEQTGIEPGTFRHLEKVTTIE